MSRAVLITGARAAVALDLAREFRRAGYAVHLADSTPCCMARLSNSVTRFHAVASPRFEPERYRRDICALAETLDPLHVIPTCEEVFHLARPSIAGVLGERLFAPPREILTVLHDKHAFARLAAAAGIAVPQTELLRASPDWMRFQDDAAAWVFKPCFSRFGARTLIGPSPETLAAMARTAGEPWIAQRRIQGREYSFYAVARAGQMAAFAAYGSSWRLSGGASFVFEPAPQAIEQALFHAASRLAAATGMSGQFSCDAMVDASGQAWLIECNPRATSGLHLLTGSGKLAAVMSGCEQSLLTSHRQSRFLLAAMCSYGVRAAARDRRWQDWWAGLRAGRDVVGAPADRLPLAGSVLDALLFKHQARRARSTMAEILTADMEWNGERLP